MCKHCLGTCSNLRSLPSAWTTGPHVMLRHCRRFPRVVWGLLVGSIWRLLIRCRKTGRPFIIREIHCDEFPVNTLSRFWYALNRCAAGIKTLHPTAQTQAPRMSAASHELQLSHSLNVALAEHIEKTASPCWPSGLVHPNKNDIMTKCYHK